MKQNAIKSQVLGLATGIKGRKARHV